MTEQIHAGARPAEMARARRRRWRGYAVTGGIFVAGGLALTALRQSAGTDSRFVVVEQETTPSPTRTDPLMGELIRCRALPPEADDPACRAAWEENRRRFFGEDRATRVPGEPLPEFAPIPTPDNRSASVER